MASKILLIASVASTLSIAAVAWASSEGSTSDHAQPAPATKAADSAPAYSVKVTGWEGPTGEEATVQVTVKAMNGHKINLKYPAKLLVDAPPKGVTISQRKLKLKDAQLSGDKSITFTVVAIPNKAGQYQLSGLLRVGVCNESQCLINKRRFSARLTAQ